MNTIPKGSGSARSSEPVKFGLVPHLSKMYLLPIPVGFHTTLCFGLCRISHMHVSGLIFGCAFLHISLSQLLHPSKNRRFLLSKGSDFTIIFFNSEQKFSLSMSHLPKAEMLDPKSLNMFNFTLE